MSQHDMTVDNGAGLAVRADLNLALKALASQSSGASAPSPTFPAQVWADTGTGRLKQRDAANATWVDKGPIDGAMAPLDSPVFTGQPQGNFPGLVGSVRNAKMSITTASASATFTADEVVVKSALGGLAYRIASFSKAINLATTGAGGMDVGTAPVSGNVALYAIYNPATSTSALLAVNSSSSVAPSIYGGANMPAGYTASALVSVWVTNASSQFIIGIQFDRKVAVALAQQLVTNTQQASPTALTLTAIPISAKFVDGVLSIGSSSAGTNIAKIYASSTGIGEQDASAYGAVASASISTPFSAMPLISAQTVYYTCSAQAGTMIFYVFINGYSF